MGIATKNPDLPQHTLCHLLSSEVDAALTSTLGPDDWRVLAAAARREGVAPLLYHTLNEAEMLALAPSDVRAELRQTYYATTARNLLLYRELSRILTALSPPSQSAMPNPQSEIRNPQSAIPTIILKGAALAATVYDSIGLRPMGDVDLLVPEEHLAEAVARLKALGYVEPYPDIAAGFNALFGHHVHLQGGQDIHLAVELHWTLIGGQHDRRSPSLPWFWQQTEEWRTEDRSWRRCPEPVEGLEDRVQSSTSNLQSAIRNPQFAILTPTAHLLYLCAHLMLQHGEAHSPLRWFYDIHLLVTREGQRIDWDELVLRAQDFHWASALHAALAGTAARFATPLPVGFSESLIESVDSRNQALVQRKAGPQTRGEKVSDVLASFSWRARLQLVLAHVIPSPAYVRWRYKPRPVWLWPLCYPYRWLDILREGLTTLWKMANNKWRIADGG
jgi:hypothetical protein